MPIPNSRRRGVCILFRRKIPLCLRHRFGAVEISRSIGRAAPGEARRIINRLWHQTETLFMYVRSQPQLSRDDIHKVTNAALDEFRDLVDIDLAMVMPEIADDHLDEPINQRDRYAGMAQVLKSQAVRGNLTPMSDTARRHIQVETGLAVPAGGIDDRLVSRRMMEVLGAEAVQASAQFKQMAQRRRSEPLDLPMEVHEFPDVISDEALAILRAAQVGDDLNWIFGVSTNTATKSSVTKSLAQVAQGQVSAPAPAAPAAPAPAPAAAQPCPVPQQPPATVPIQQSLPLAPSQPTTNRSPASVPPAPSPSVPVAPPAQSATATIGLRNGDKKLSELWPVFSQDMVREGRWRGSANQSESTKRLFIRICGDKKLSEYGSADGAAFKRALLDLPSDYYHGGRWRELFLNKGPAAVIAECERAIAAGGKVVRVKPKTANRHRSAIAGLWEWGQQNEALCAGSPNIFDGQHIKVDKRKSALIAQSTRREPWADDHLVNLFKSTVFTGLLSRRNWIQPGSFVIRDERYWGILIGSLSGMRREEIFQLRVEHLKQDKKTGIWYFDLYAEGLRLKDTGSPRLVPIHDVLLRLGFIEARVLNRRPKDMLFPEVLTDDDQGVLAESKKAGESFGKWFGRYRRSKQVNAYIKEDFHALRHLFTTLAANAGASRVHIEELVGHESDQRRSEFDRYYHGATLNILKAVVDKVVLPIDVDLLLAAVHRSEALNAKTVWPDL